MREISLNVASPSYKLDEFVLHLPYNYLAKMFLYFISYRHFVRQNLSLKNRFLPIGIFV